MFRQEFIDKGWKLNTVLGTLTCPECSAAVGGAEECEQHEEWHKTLSTAIREQVEEEFETWKATYSTGRPPLPSMTMPTVVTQSNVKVGSNTDCAHCGHRKSLHEMHDGYMPYGRCNHGHDLCGCSQYEPPKCKHSWMELDDGQYLCIWCKKRNERDNG